MNLEILAGYYDNIDENTAILTTLKLSGRLEINRFKKRKEDCWINHTIN